MSDKAIQRHLLLERWAAGGGVVMVHEHGGTMWTRSDPGRMKELYEAVDERIIPVQKLLKAMVDNGYDGFISRWSPVLHRNTTRVDGLHPTRYSGHTQTTGKSDRARKGSNRRALKDHLRFY